MVDILSLREKCGLISNIVFSVRKRVHFEQTSFEMFGFLANKLLQRGTRKKEKIAK